ncbi:hypothetical protein SALBM135S_03339 [Streptomyces alboniger]
MADNGSTETGGLSRRRLLGTAGATGLAIGAAGGGAAGYAAASSSGPSSSGSGGSGTGLVAIGAEQVMFHGKHQPGITTPMQSRGHLVAFDLKAGAGRKEAAALLRRWSKAAERLMAGDPVDDDTAVARDAGPSSLSVTFGFGASFFALYGAPEAAPGRPGAAAGLLLRPPGQGAQQR